MVLQTQMENHLLMHSRLQPYPLLLIRPRLGFASSSKVILSELSTCHGPALQCSLCLFAVTAKLYEAYALLLGNVISALQSQIVCYVTIVHRWSLRERCCCCSNSFVCDALHMCRSSSLLLIDLDAQSCCMCQHCGITLVAWNTHRCSCTCMGYLWLQCIKAWCAIA